MGVMYLVDRNSMSLCVFSSVSLGVSSRSSRSSGVTRGKFPMLLAALPPPRLAEDELDVELRPESATGDACHSRRKSGASKGARQENVSEVPCCSICTVLSWNNLMFSCLFLHGLFPLT